MNQQIKNEKNNCGKIPSFWGFIAEIIFCIAAHVLRNHISHPQPVISTSVCDYLDQAVIFDQIAWRTLIQWPQQASQRATTTTFFLYTCDFVYFLSQYGVNVNTISWLVETPNACAFHNKTMAAWSKLLDLSCYEMGHTWTPSCSQAAFDVGKSGYYEAFKVYAPIYLVGWNIHDKLL